MASRSHHAVSSSRNHTLHTTITTSTPRFAPDGRNKTLVAVATLFLALSWITVSLRVYVRGFQLRGAFGRDDWLMLVTLAFFTLQSGFIITIAETEIRGRVDEDIIVELFEYTMLDIAFYICTSIFLKLTLAIFFLRVLVERWQRWVIKTSVSIYALYTITYLLICIFQCGNPTHFLVRHIEDRCLGWGILSPLNYLHASLNALSDWIFALVPILFIRRTRMPRQAKISVCLILALGALGSVASLVRIGYISDLEASYSEFYYEAVGIGVASTIEMGLGIVAGSLATLRPLLRSLLERTESRRHSSRHVRDGAIPCRRGVGEVMEMNQGDDLAVYETPESVDKGNSSISATTYAGSSLGTMIAATDACGSAGDSGDPHVLTLPPTDRAPSNLRSTTPSARHSVPTGSASHIRIPEMTTQRASCYLEGKGVWRDGWEDLESVRTEWLERPRRREMTFLGPDPLLPDPESDRDDGQDRNG